MTFPEGEWEAANRDALADACHERSQALTGHCAQPWFVGPTLTAEKKSSKLRNGVGELGVRPECRSSPLLSIPHL